MSKFLDSRPALYVSVSLFLLVLSLSVTLASPHDFQEPCYGDPECYEDPPASVPESGESSPPWEGYRDGRLNPDPAEYYSVWCQEDVVRVLRAVPPPTALVDGIPLLDVLNLAEGASFGRESGLTVTRNSADTITVSGSNGNLAPQPGSKSFSLSECIARNGSVPDQPEEVPPSLPQSPPEDERTICLSLGTTDDITDCLLDLPDLSGLELLWILIAQLCAYTPLGVVIVPGSLGLLLRRGRRQRRR